MIVSLHTRQYTFLSTVDKEVDGETLILLAQGGTMEQLGKCGLKSIKDQLKLKMIVKQLLPPPPTVDKTSATPAVVGPQVQLQDRKLTLKEAALLSPEEKQMYLIRYVPSTPCTCFTVSYIMA